MEASLLQNCEGLEKLLNLALQKIELESSFPIFLLLGWPNL